MPIVTLTPAFMASGLVAQPGAKRTEYCDTEVRGLLIECRSAANAVPTWYLRYKANGKTAYTRLGNVQDLGLAQARKQAITLKAQHTLAPKNAVEAKAPIGSMTLDVFMRDHYFPHAELHKRSHKRDDQLYRLRIAPKFGHTQLNQITRHAVQQFHLALVKEHGLSPASADLHIALLRHALNLAVEWEMLERNVLKGFKLLLVNNRVDNYLNDEDVERLKEVLLTDTNRPVCMALLWLLVTGARLSSGLHCKWTDIDTANEVWLVPATDAKSKKPNPHYLNESALWILRQMAGKGASEYVFANPETGKPYTTITKVWYKVRRKAKINPKTRIHDLRHSWAHRVLAAGHSVAELQMAMHHADPRTTMIYCSALPRMMKQVAGSASLRLEPPKPPLVIEAA